MTFNSIDDILAFFEQFAADRQREFETGMLLRADEIHDDIGDTLDGSRELQEQAMEMWCLNFRRQLEAMPLRFPLHATLSGFDERKRISECRGK